METSVTDLHLEANILPLRYRLEQHYFTKLYV